MLRGRQELGCRTWVLLENLLLIRYATLFIDFEKCHLYISIVYLLRLAVLLGVLVRHRCLLD